MNNPDVTEQEKAPTPVACSAWLEVLRKYWNERIERKRSSARNFAAGGEYSIAARMAAEAEATELCLKDLETESTSNGGTEAPPT